MATSGSCSHLKLNTETAQEAGTSEKFNNRNVTAEAKGG
jgi:hypothetical protein